MSEKIRIDTFRAFDQVMVKATDLATGHFSIATGRRENAVRAKAISRIRRRMRAAEGMPS